MMKWEQEARVGWGHAARHLPLHTQWFPCCTLGGWGSQQRETGAEATQMAWWPTPSATDEGNGFKIHPLERQTIGS